MFVNCLVVLLTLGFPSYYYKFISKDYDIYLQKHDLICYSFHFVFECD